MRQVRRVLAAETAALNSAVVVAESSLGSVQAIPDGLVRLAAAVDAAELAVAEAVEHQGTFVAQHTKAAAARAAGDAAQADELAGALGAATHEINILRERLGRSLEAVMGELRQIVQDVFRDWFGAWRRTRLVGFVGPLAAFDTGGTGFGEGALETAMSWTVFIAEMALRVQQAVEKASSCLCV